MIPTCSCVPSMQCIESFNTFLISKHFPDSKCYLQINNLIVFIMTVNNFLRAAASQTPLFFLLVLLVHNTDDSNIYRAVWRFLQCFRWMRQLWLRLFLLEFNICIKNTNSKKNSDFTTVYGEVDNFCHVSDRCAKSGQLLLLFFLLVSNQNALLAGYKKMDILVCPTNVTLY